MEDEQTQERLISEKEAAHMLGICLRTLQAWRRNKTGPPHMRFNFKTIRYKTEDVEAYINKAKDDYEPED